MIDIEKLWPQRSFSDATYYSVYEWNTVEHTSDGYTNPGWWVSDWWSDGSLGSCFDEKQMRLSLQFRDSLMRCRLFWSGKIVIKEKVMDFSKALKKLRKRKKTIRRSSWDSGFIFHWCPEEKELMDNESVFVLSIQMFRRAQLVIKSFTFSTVDVLYFRLGGVCWVMGRIEKVILGDCLEKMQDILINLSTWFLRILPYQM